METITVQDNAFKASSKLRLKWEAWLSDIEYKIVKQTAYGLTQKEVAEIFHRSPFTITNTLRRAYRKTGARNITELSVWVWCRKFHVTMIISEGKRTIVSAIMLLLVISLEFSPCKMDLRARSRTRRSKEEYECVTETFDFTEPPAI